MPTDYEKVYQRQRHALGDPTQEFVTFFDHYDRQNADVLDVGCGQGRDALFIARRGHHVVGVDMATTGIAQLLEEAQAGGLNIEGVVADLRNFEPVDTYDVVVIDRTLHMLEADTRLSVLERICHSVREDGYVLIADEKSNLPAMRTLFETDNHRWATLKNSKGFLFVHNRALT
jgi:2-polyprenyl-3-methyl-5-hydroxy-6-metoxy-1,4-benzoquinol methylase